MTKSTSKQPLPLVVVADPDPLYQLQIMTLLEGEFQCLPTNTLQETYQVIQREHPDMLILEPDQPDGDGITLVRELQADPLLKDILIACVTQRNSVRDKMRAFRAGTDEYVVTLCWGSSLAASSDHAAGVVCPLASSAVSRRLRLPANG